MTSKLARATGIREDGRMIAKRLGEHLGVAHGTIKRWLHDGMPAERTKVDGNTWIDPIEAKAWIEQRFAGRKTIAFQRRGFVYFVEREDGAIKIGWSSDVMRRLQEIRKDNSAACQLIACYPGDKPDELRLHGAFSDCLIGDEWFRPEEHLTAFIDALGSRGAEQAAE